MLLTFVGADHEVTGSCHYLQVGDSHILVDCGMEQGRDAFENVPIPVPPSKIDYVFITHAHIDHTGLLPKLYHDGFRGVILATPATHQLADIMLRDAAHIQQQEAETRNRKAAKRGLSEQYEPIYTMQDAMMVMHQFQDYGYDEIYTLNDNIRFRFTDIGHLLGSASIELWLTENGEERKIVFSGDIGNIDQPLLRDPQTTDEADYVVMESTYGNRYHDAPTGDRVQQLADVIRDTMRRGGNLVIPAFAVGRTQVMLYYIRQIKTENMIPECPDFPVYVDSPMAVEATSVFEHNDLQCYDEDAEALVRQGINPISFKGLHLMITKEESMSINDDPEPKVIISASGMCDAGRIKHHLRYNISRPDSTIMFVGYQAEGSLGRRITDGAGEITIFGEKFKVNAHIAVIDSMSGHADKNGLLHWIEAFKKKPEKVFVVHGDDDQATAFTQCLRDEHGFDAYAPFSGTEFDLLTGEFRKVTKGVPIVKAGAAHTVSDSYTKLRIAQRRLDQVIDAGKGLPNKDLDAFTKAINDLCRQFGISPKQ